MERIKINLEEEPSKRWDFLEKYKKEVNSLIKYYLDDLTDAGIFQEYIDTYKERFISESYKSEIKAISNFTSFSENEILITNLYYDALKFVFGCTAFCVSNKEDKLHARNLDWWSENDMLRKHTKIFDFTKNDNTVYSLVSWPGFVGALSGVKKGAFSITLNAVLSNEAPQFAIPITFLIRDVLEKVSDFNEAVKILSETPIASDCLLMIVGCKENESLVIERTPTKFSLRKPEDNALIVTNEYLRLSENKITNDTLQLTASGRYNRTKYLLGKRNLNNTEDYFEVLSDKEIKMDMTVQQMVFNPKTGEIHLKT